jgi:uncharacterized protein YjiS (DUF1127 family)
MSQSRLVNSSVPLVAARSQPVAAPKALPERPMLARPWLFLGTPGALVALWLERARRRQELRDLTPTQIKDTGLNSAAVAAEAAKPFWRA